MAWKGILSLCFPLVGLAALCGCGPDTSGLPKTVPAEGVVLLDGQPVHGASLVAAPEGGQHPANALSDENGHFALTAFPEMKTGAVPGTYKVQVTKTVEVQGGARGGPRAGTDDAAHAAESGTAGVTWVNEMPEKYSNFESTDLTITIPEDGTTDLRIELTSD